jgi:hypothetical protein
MYSESLPRLPYKGKNGRHCWVIKWHEDERYPFTKNFLYILPWRWTSQHVLEHVLCLYHNSPVIMIFERGGWMNSKTRCGILISIQGPRITVGGNPFLVASRVKDFRVVLDSERRVEIVSYTQPPGVRWIRGTNEIENDGFPVPVRIEMRF